MAWDKRTLTLAVVGGNGPGMLFFFMVYQPFMRYFLHFSGIAIVTILVGLLIVPGLVSASARRRPFWWGIVPTLFLNVWLVSLNALQNGGRKTGVLYAIGATGWVISSGVVSLTRLSLNQHHRKKAAPLAEYRRQRAAAAIPQEGVWPPPPNHMSSDTAD